VASRYTPSELVATDESLEATELLHNETAKL
jgi:hypothetical protein